ncbi:alpha/beta fold hydrolase (plasmid) [Agrobacterium pusense]|uniref:alpha/beta hydrolase n=1 Tax=Agrobacterium TaxID=357 RepID=UPI0007D91BCA|nr:MULTISPECIES: alpha/beta fold hydrolase [Agrobacterium]MBW9075610.1 alpha/beta fold hydrolase [Agrobacterium deltaense]WMW59129.1 alpha/beta fold hydrolase [Agrobacterium pusense]
MKADGKPVTGCRRFILLMICCALSGCATRPSERVLQPTQTRTELRQVTILVATNRTRSGRGYSDGRGKGLTYEQFQVSIPPNHERSKIEYPDERADPERSMLISARQSLGERAFVEKAAVPSPEGTVGIFVHGYNYTYQESLYRLGQIAADAPLSGHPVLFSWPSEGRVAGYLADREAALYSRDDLTALLTSVTRASPAKRIVLFGHSVGSFLVMETLRQLRLQGRDDVLDRLMVVLAAPDIDEDLFHAQLQAVGRMTNPITVFVSKNDKALAISSLLTGERARVGQLDVDSPTVKAATKQFNLRIVDVTAIDGPDALGHDQYANIAGQGTRISSTNMPEVGTYILTGERSATSAPLGLGGALIGVQ